MHRRVTRNARPRRRARLRRRQHAAGRHRASRAGHCHGADVQTEHAKPTSSSFAAGLHRVPPDSPRHAAPPGTRPAPRAAATPPAPRLRCTDPARLPPTRRFPPTRAASAPGATTAPTCPSSTPAPRPPWPASPARPAWSATPTACRRPRTAPPVTPLRVSTTTRPERRAHLADQQPAASAPAVTTPPRSCLRRPRQVRRRGGEYSSYATSCDLCHKNGNPTPHRLGVRAPARALHRACATRPTASGMSRQAHRDRGELDVHRRRTATAPTCTGIHGTYADLTRCGICHDTRRTGPRPPTA